MYLKIITYFQLEVDKNTSPIENNKMDEKLLGELGIEINQTVSRSGAANIQCEFRGSNQKVVLYFGEHRIKVENLKKFPKLHIWNYNQTPFTLTFNEIVMFCSNLRAFDSTLKDMFRIPEPQFEKTICLNKNVKMTICKPYGKFQIRQFEQAKNGALYPTHRGLTITKNEFTCLHMFLIGSVLKKAPKLAGRLRCEQLHGPSITGLPDDMKNKCYLCSPQTIKVFPVNKNLCLEVPMIC